MRILKDQVIRVQYPDGTLSPWFHADKDADSYGVYIKAKPIKRVECIEVYGELIPIADIEQETTK
jgi:hypothetical protein